MIILFILTYYFHINTIHPAIDPHVALLNYNFYTHQGKEIIFHIYNVIDKNLILQLASHNIQHCPDQKTTWFIYPNITIFNEKNIKLWNIKCNKAQLHHKKVLNLYGHVFINKIIKSICTQSIITNQLVINLTNHNMISKHKTIIQGHYFYSIGSCMHTNLHTQTIKLFGKIYTQYEIKKM